MFLRLLFRIRALIVEQYQKQKVLLKQLYEIKAPILESYTKQDILVTKTGQKKKDKSKIEAPVFKIVFLDHFFAVFSIKKVKKKIRAPIPRAMQKKAKKPAFIDQTQKK